GYLATGLERHAQPSLAGQCPRTDQPPAPRRRDVRKASDQCQGPGPVHLRYRPGPAYSCGGTRWRGKGRHCAEHAQERKQCVGSCPPAARLAPEALSPDRETWLGDLAGEGAPDLAPPLRDAEHSLTTTIKITRMSTMSNRLTVLAPPV